MSALELCEFVDRNTVRFTRHYPHPMSLVWSALTDPDQLSVWFLPVQRLEAKLGGRYSLPTPNGPLEGLFTEFDPPRVINFGGGMRFELFEEKDGCRLVFTLLRAQIGWAPGVLGGFDCMWENLRDHLRGVGREQISRSNAVRWHNIFPVYEREISRKAAGGAKIIYRLLFDSLATDFQSGSRPLLDEALELLKKRPDLNVVVDAYCDDPVGETESMALARRRADTVVEHLEKAGVSRGRIIPRVFGNTHALRLSDTEPGRQINRRVELMPTY